MNTSQHNDKLKELAAYLAEHADKLQSQGMALLEEAAMIKAKSNLISECLKCPGNIDYEYDDELPF